MSDTQPTNADLLVAIQASTAQQQDAGTQVLGLLSQVRDGLNGVDFTMLASIMPTLGELTDRISAMDSKVFALTQRINQMSDDLSTQIAAGVATLQADFATLATGLSGLEASAAQAVADAQARDTTDAQSLAALQALHAQASSMVASLPSSAPAAPPADPAPAPSDPTPAPSGDTGSTGAAPAGDTGATGTTSDAPPADGGSTAATA